jgi:CubicO group peptidase (beta-lactamase class C family)
MRAATGLLAFAFAAVVAASPGVPASDARDSVDDTLESRIEALRVEGRFPGLAVAVMVHGEPVGQVTLGRADLAHGVPVTSRTVFETASLTKHMTALAVMTLVQEGKLGLQDRLADYVDDAPPAWDAITIDQLLSHMAGLAHRFEPSLDGVLLLENSRESMLEAARNTPVQAEPGTDWEYSDQGYFLLGLVVERVTGRSFAEHMQDTFFAPLGMAQTHLLDQRRIVPHLAQGYALVDGELQRNRRVWNFELASHFGVLSSLADLATWEAELANPTIVDPEALAATFEIQRRFENGGSCDEWGYARGWWVAVVDGRRLASHAGYSGAAYVRDLDRGVSVLVLGNREDTPDALSPLALAWRVAHMADPSIPAEGPRCWEAD